MCVCVLHLIIVFFLYRNLFLNIKMMTAMSKAYLKSNKLFEKFLISLGPIFLNKNYGGNITNHKYFLSPRLFFFNYTWQRRTNIQCFLIVDSYELQSNFFTLLPETCAEFKNPWYRPLLMTVLPSCSTLFLSSFRFKLKFIRCVLCPHSRIYFSDACVLSPYFCRGCF